jgi:hypothetical protein
MAAGSSVVFCCESLFTGGSGRKSFRRSNVNLTFTVFNVYTQVRVACCLLIEDVPVTLIER